MKKILKTIVAIALLTTSAFAFEVGLTNAIGSKNTDTYTKFGVNFKEKIAEGSFYKIEGVFKTDLYKYISAKNIDDSVLVDEFITTIGLKETLKPANLAVDYGIGVEKYRGYYGLKIKTDMNYFMYMGFEQKVNNTLTVATGFNYSNKKIGTHGKLNYKLNDNLSIYSFIKYDEIKDLNPYTTVQIGSEFGATIKF